MKYIRKYSLICLLICLIEVLVLFAFGLNPFYRLQTQVKTIEERNETKRIEQQELSYNDNYGDYLDKSKVFDNLYEQAVPQTIVYQLVINHFNSPVDNDKTKMAIIIGYDGFRADIIPYLIDNSGIACLKETGGLYLSYAGGKNKDQDTSSGPGWTSILTSVWADTNGVLDNTTGINSRLATFFVELGRQGVEGTFLSAWRPLFSSVLRSEIVNTIIEDLPVDYISAIDDEDTYYQVLKKVSNNRNSKLIMAIFDNSDTSGHQYGYYNNEEYYNACFNVDHYAYNILQAINSRDTYSLEDWLIVITTDHGGINKTHGGQSNLERITWIATNKKSYLFE